MKEEIRKKLLKLRLGHSEEERRAKSKRVKRHLFEMREFQDAETVAFYVSIRGEVFTLDMIHEALELDKRIAVPVTDWQKKKLRFAEIHSLAELSRTPKGLWEPDVTRARPVKPAEIDLIAVPGVAFDLRGHRLGYGMGFYDGALGKMKALSVGLAFEFQLVDELPVNASDVAVKKIATEKGVLKCGR